VARKTELIGPTRRLFDNPDGGNYACLAADDYLVFHNKAESAIFVVLAQGRTKAGLFLGMDRHAATSFANGILEAVRCLPPPKRDGLDS
jgi:hypothetical protein